MLDISRITFTTGHTDLNMALAIVTWWLTGGILEVINDHLEESAVLA